MLNKKQLAAKSKLLPSLIRNSLYADDCNMQHLMDSFPEVCTLLCLKINLKRTSMCTYLYQITYFCILPEISVCKRVRVFRSYCKYVKYLEWWNLPYESRRLGMLFENWIDVYDLSMEFPLRRNRKFIILVLCYMDVRAGSLTGDMWKGWNDITYNVSAIYWVSSGKYTWVMLIYTKAVSLPV